MKRIENILNKTTDKELQEAYNSIRKSEKETGVYDNDLLRQIASVTVDVMNKYDVDYASKRIKEEICNRFSSKEVEVSPNSKETIIIEEDVFDKMLIDKYGYFQNGEIFPENTLVPEYTIIDTWEKNPNDLWDGTFAIIKRNCDDKYFRVDYVERFDGKLCEVEEKCEEVELKAKTVYYYE